MLLHIPFAFFTSDLFIVTIFLGTMCSAFSVWLLLKLSNSSSLCKALFIMLPLCSLRAVIFYSNSGLENSLNYLLIAIFSYVLAIKPAHKTLCRDCTLIVALAGVNRLDMVLLLGPPFLLMLLLRKIPFSLSQAVEGSLPLLLWLEFAMFYYGSPLPNTYFAKLPASSQPVYLWWDGIHYLELYFRNDPVGFCILMLSFLIAIRSLMRYRKSQSRLDGACFSIAIGSVIYCLYIISIGGDYLMGRFWTAPTFASMACLALSFQKSWQESRKFIYALAGYTACILSAAYALFFLSNDRLQQLAHGHYPGYGLIWSWVPYHDTEKNVLFDSHWHIHLETNHDMQLYKIIKERYDRYKDTSPLIWDALGLNGYFGNPETIRIDPVGIGDAFLARLPATSIMIGHMGRDIPKGYVHAVQTGSTDEMDSDLAEYYKALRLIISGPLFSMERLATLGRFQLGYYDHYRDAYLARQNPAP